MNIILQPCTSYYARTNYYKTIIKSINLNDFKTVLGHDYNELKEIYKSGFAHVWGIKKGKSGYGEEQYFKIKPGDMVLFQQIYYGKSMIVASGIVTKTIQNVLMGKKLFNDKTDSNYDFYQYLYFLDNIYLLRNEKIYLDDIWPLINENNKKLYKITVLDKNDSSKIVDKYQLKNYIK